MSIIRRLTGKPTAEQRIERAEASVLDLRQRLNAHDATIRALVVKDGKNEERLAELEQALRNILTPGVQA